MPKVYRLRQELDSVASTTPGEHGHYLGDCRDCGRKNVPVARRNEDGSLTCMICAYPPEECCLCHHVKQVATRMDEQKGHCKGGPLAVCYDCSATPETCAICKRVRPIYKRLGGKKGEGPGACKACATILNKKKCRWCGKIKPVARSVRKKGQPRSAGLPCCAYCNTTETYLTEPKF